jgi:hypothetical protein
VLHVPHSQSSLVKTSDATYRLWIITLFALKVNISDYETRHDFKSPHTSKRVRCENIKAITIKDRPSVFFNVPSCGLVEIYRRFGRTCCVHLQGKRVSVVSCLLGLPSDLMMGTESPAEMAGKNIYETTRCHISEDSRPAIFWDV